MLYAASLWLSNSAYLYLSVSFIQMTKSLMPGLVYATGIAFGTERFTRGSVLNMLLIVFGVVVCAVGEVNLVPRGVMQQLAALLFEVTSPLRTALSTSPPHIIVPSGGMLCVCVWQTCMACHWAGVGEVHV